MGQDRVGLNGAGNGCGVGQATGFQRDFRDQSPAAASVAKVAQGGQQGGQAGAAGASTRQHSQAIGPGQQQVVHRHLGGFVDDHMRPRPDVQLVPQPCGFAGPQIAAEDG